MKKSTQTRITRYTLELFVIIFGISVSFLLNEWRENRQNFKAEGAALHAIYDDLIADSLVISNEAKLLANNQTYYNYFLKKVYSENANPDSIVRAIGAFAMYTTLETKNVAYEQLKATGQLGLITNKILLKEIVEIYTNEYGITRELSSIDKKMVLEQYIPYLLKESPLSLNDLNNNFDLKNPKYLKLIRDKTFLNMFVININFKDQNIQRYKNLNDNIRKVLNGINTEMKERFNYKKS
ncbi:MAG: hypothetical protein H6627_12900 [Calditrichae bacterium]|nr:hypothetical protein [Calditrichota bacterium]MCB9059462.1 hypothetical protein [Calditrichia bacterium]